MPQQQQEKAVTPLQIPQDEQIRKDLGFVDVTQQTESVDPAVSKTADDWLEKILSRDLSSPATQEEIRGAVEGAGEKVQQTMARKSGLLKGQIRTLASQAEGNPVAKSLIDLKVQVDKINPNNFKLLAPGGIGRVFTWIPGVGTTMNKYFTQWQSAGSVIDSIVMQIREGSCGLQRDIGVLRNDQIDMRTEILRLQKVIQILMLVNEKLTAKVEAMDEGSDQRRFLEEEILFSLRQRIGDLQESLAVNQQGVMAYEFVIRTNRELIRGAKRCENITVRALEVATVLAMALANQRMVLHSIQAVDETTSLLMKQNGEQLKVQGTEIFKQSASQSISIDTLKKVYTDLDSAFEEMATFKQKALPEMAQRMAAMSEMAKGAEKKIKRMEDGNVARPSIELDLEPTAEVA